MYVVYIQMWCETKQLCHGRPQKFFQWCQNHKGSFQTSVNLRFFRVLSDFRRYIVISDQIR